MKFLTVIPARSGSKGIPNKNIYRLGDWPLMCWSIRASLQANEISRTFVSTDCPKYAEIAESFGAEVPFLRPANISGDSSSDLEFFQHFVDYTDNCGLTYESIVHLRPTSPFRDPSIINDAIIRFKQSPDASSLRSIHKMSESAYKCFVLDSSSHLSSLSGVESIDLCNDARQSFPPTYQANGYVDIVRVSSIRDGFLHGKRSLGFETPFCPEIDTYEDLKYATYLADTQPSLALRLNQFT